MGIGAGNPSGVPVPKRPWFAPLPAPATTPGHQPQQSLTNLGLNFRNRLRFHCGDRMKDHTSSHRGVNPMEYMGNLVL